MVSLFRNQKESIFIRPCAGALPWYKPSFGRRNKTALTAPTARSASAGLITGQIDKLLTKSCPNCRLFTGATKSEGLHGQNSYIFEDVHKLQHIFIFSLLNPRAKYLSLFLNDLRDMLLTSPVLLFFFFSKSRLNLYTC